MAHISRYITIVITLLLSQTVRAQEAVILHTIHFPPYSIDSRIVASDTTLTAEDGIYGSDVDIIRAAFDSQGIEAVFKIRPWKRIMRDVKAGLLFGAVSCRPMPSREPFAYFSEVVSHSSMILATNKGLWGAERALPLELLKTEKPMVIAGWAQELVLTERNIDYSVVNGIQQGVSLILHRNQNVFMTDKESLVYVLDKENISNLFSIYPIQGLDVDEYSVCVSKAFPDSKHYLDLLNKGIVKLRQSGQIAAIYKRYGIQPISTNKDNGQ